MAAGQGGDRSMGDGLDAPDGLPVVVFDLDDTLYEEMSFVRGGFREVAGYWAGVTGGDVEQMYAKLLRILEEEGRGRVFDRFLEEIGKYSRKNVRLSVGLYRSHKPDIRLYPDAAAALDRLPARAIYVVTDGHKDVQWTKIQALGLDRHPRVRRCFLTNRYGISRQKPNPYCFLLICKKERIIPERVVHVGDNPLKDFVGLKPLGFRTVHLLRGAYAGIRVAEAYEADVSIRTLDELDGVLADWFGVRSPVCVYRGKFNASGKE